MRGQTRLQNRVHDILARYGLTSPFSDLLGLKGPSYLQKLLPTLDPAHQGMLSDDLAVIDRLNERIKEVSARTRRRAKDEPSVQLLESMPGIGTYSAWVIFTEIGDFSHFSSAKQLSSYAGLVPSTYSSDQRIYHGRITKQGSSSLR